MCKFTNVALFLRNYYWIFLAWAILLTGCPTDDKDFPITIERSGADQVSLEEEGESTWQLTVQEDQVSVRLEDNWYYQEHSLQFLAPGNYALLSDLGGNGEYFEMWMEGDEYHFYTDSEVFYRISGFTLPATDRETVQNRAIINFIALNLAIDRYVATAIAFLPLVR